MDLTISSKETEATYATLLVILYVEKSKNVKIQSEQQFEI